LVAPLISYHLKLPRGLLRFKQLTDILGNNRVMLDARRAGLKMAYAMLRIGYCLPHRIRLSLVEVTGLMQSGNLRLSIFRNWIPPFEKAMNVM
jgi:hypothetical protein